MVGYCTSLILQYVFFVYPHIYLETFWPAFTLMKMSKGKPTRKRMEKYVIKLLGQNLQKERKLYGRFQFHKAMVFYIIYQYFAGKKIKKLNETYNSTLHSALKNPTLLF